MKEITYASKAPNRPWYTKPEEEKLVKGVNIRLRVDEFDELKALLNKEQQSMTLIGRILLRKHLKKLRRKYK